ncbi:HAD family hydrolase [Shewanella sp. 125m-1]
MSKIERVALVDFCETLVDLQTADEYIEYCVKDSFVKVLLIRLMRNRILNKILKKLFKRYKSPKPFILRLVKGKNAAFMEKKAKEFSLLLETDFVIKDVIEEIRELKNNGYRIIIVSGGYDIYINHFMPVLIDDVISTEIDYFDGVCTGKIKGVDCLEENKVKKIDKYLCGHSLDYETCIVYSDSKTDMPLFNLGETKVVISRESEKHWVRECHGFIEKVWHK